MVSSVAGPCGRNTPIIALEFPLESVRYLVLVVNLTKERVRTRAIFTARNTCTLDRQGAFRSITKNFDYLEKKDS